MGSRLDYRRIRGAKPTGGSMDAPPGRIARSLDEVVAAVKPRKKPTKHIREVKMPTFKGGL